MGTGREKTGPAKQGDPLDQVNSRVQEPIGYRAKKDLLKWPLNPAYHFINELTESQSSKVSWSRSHG